METEFAPRAGSGGYGSGVAESRSKLRLKLSLLLALAAGDVPADRRRVYHAAARTTTTRITVRRAASEGVMAGRGIPARKTGAPRYVPPAASLSIDAPRPTTVISMPQHWWQPPPLIDGRQELPEPLLLFEVGRHPRRDAPLDQSGGGRYVAGGGRARSRGRRLGTLWHSRGTGRRTCLWRAGPSALRAPPSPR